MSELTIPEGHYPNFIEFIELSSENKIKLFKNLDTSEEFNKIQLIEYISKNIPAIETDTIANIISVYSNLTNAKNTFGNSLDEFIVFLKKALLETGITKLNPTEEILTDFKKLLSSGKKIIEKTKVIELMSENPCNFIKSKINQDIRPYFNDKGILVGSTIINTLKIIVQKNNKVSDIYISMDTNDITELLDELKKAQANIKLIQSNFSNAKIIEP